jgi:hypothetical protein
MWKPCASSRQKWPTTVPAGTMSQLGPQVRRVRAAEPIAGGFRADEVPGSSGARPAQSSGIGWSMHLSRRPRRALGAVRACSPAHIDAASVRTQTNGPARSVATEAFRATRRTQPIEPASSASSSRSFDPQSPIDCRGGACGICDNRRARATKSECYARRRLLHARRKRRSRCLR